MAIERVKVSEDQNRRISARAKRIAGTAVRDRWMAEISYRDDTPTTVVAFEEIEDLDEIVELGPDWNLIDRIVITLNRPTLEPQPQ